MSNTQVLAVYRDKAVKNYKEVVQFIVFYDRIVEEHFNTNYF